MPGARRKIWCMRKIYIVSDEHRDEIREKRKLQKKNRIEKEFRKRSVCICSRKFTLAHVAKEGHPGFCSWECSGGIKPPKKHKQKRKNNDRSVRQKRRLDINKYGVAFYLCREWRELRYRMFREWSWKCMSCGRTPPEVKIHVDHIKPRSKYPDLELSIENLQLLCEDCNMGKSNLYEDDLRSQGVKRK